MLLKNLLWVTANTDIHEAQILKYCDLKLHHIVKNVSNNNLQVDVLELKTVHSG
jgi:hypothetical protein